MKDGLLVLLRHGESTWNAEGRFAGSTDVALSEKGRVQAHAAGARLKGLELDFVCTSSLLRAIHTWEILSAHRSSTTVVMALDWLRERDFGLLEGEKKSDLAARYGAEQVEKWRFGWKEALPKGSGETFVQMRRRVLPPFEQDILPRLHKGSNILLVAHGQVLRSIAMHLENARASEAKDYSMDNASPLAYRINRQEVECISL